MKKFRIALGAMAIPVAAVAIIACSKEKTAQQETTTQQPTESRNYTLAEMAEALSWEEGKAFFENQPVKDYTNVCENLLNDCGFDAKTAGSSYSVSWYWSISTSNCNPNCPGLCLVVKNVGDSIAGANAMGYYEDGKLIIIPTSEDNGFTEDGYLAIGVPIEIQNDSIVISEGIYAAYYDDEQGRYVAVAVDYEGLN